MKVNFWLPFLLFFLLASFGLYHHELWNDESRVWLIATDHSFWELFKVSKQEFHPFLWYWLVKPLTYVGQAKTSLKMLSLSAGLAAMAFVFKSKNISLFHKILIASNYYLLFEYTVISRNYSLLMLGIFLLAYLKNQIKINYFLIYLVLAFLPITHFYGVMFFVSFLAATLFCGKKSNLIFREKLVLSFIYILSAAYVFWFVLPADYQVKQLNVAAEIPFFLKTLETLFYSIYYISDPRHFESVRQISTYPIFMGFVVLSLALGLFKVISSYRLLNKSAIILVICFLLQFILVALFRAHELLPKRHVGCLVLLLIYVLLTEKRKSYGLGQSALTLVLLLQAYSGLSSLYLEYRQPFSSGALAADYINANDMQISYFDSQFFASSLNLNLKQKMRFENKFAKGLTYFPLDENFYKNLFLFDSKIITSPDITSYHLQKEFCAYGTKRSLFVVFNYLIDGLNIKNISFKLVKAFDNSILSTENLYLYQYGLAEGLLCPE